MESKNLIHAIGVDDRDIFLFEGQYPVPHGISYNSYLIEDDKICILDTVDARFVDRWIKNIESVLKGRNPDYLIVHHMEPDHSSGIEKLFEKYPNIRIVGNEKTFQMIQNFHRGIDISERFISVKDGQEFSLGNSTLKFVFAPFVHWPEVMVSYLKEKQILFSADAFGKFGSSDFEEDYESEARRYYYGIVGKYGLQTGNLLKKLKDDPIREIYPLHGPLLKENIDRYLSLYRKWSSYQYENDGVCIACASVYGHTMEATKMLKAEIEKSSGIQVELFDLSETDVSYVISKAFMYRTLILASITYNGDLFPSMNRFIQGLTERNYQNRRIGIIENGSWSCTVKKKISDHFSASKNISYLTHSVRILSSLSEENKEELKLLSEEIIRE